MIVIFKNEQGTYSARPAYIGFIKNNIARRTLCTLFFPLILLLTIVINIIQAFACSLVLLCNAVIHPIRNITPIWKSDIWQKPRTKLNLD